MLSGTEMENQVEKMLMDSSTINLAKHVLQVGKRWQTLQNPLAMADENDMRKKYVIDWTNWKLVFNVGF